MATYLTAGVTPQVVSYFPVTKSTTFKSDEGIVSRRTYHVETDQKFGNRTVGANVTVEIDGGGSTAITESDLNTMFTHTTMIGSNTYEDRVQSHRTAYIQNHTCRFDTNEDWHTSTPSTIQVIKSIRFLKNVNDEMARISYTSPTAAAAVGEAVEQIRRIQLGYTVRLSDWYDDDEAFQAIEKRKAIRPISEQLKDMISRRQGPAIIVRSGTTMLRRSLAKPNDVREMRARQTLRRLIGEEQYRQFCTRGFISIRGQSGKMYNIAPGHTMAEVYERGRMVERLCIQLRGEYPPTDSLIMRALLIWNDEEELWAKGIRHGVLTKYREPIPNVDLRPLTEIVADIRSKDADRPFFKTTKTRVA